MIDTAWRSLIPSPGLGEGKDAERPAQTGVQGRARFDSNRAYFQLQRRLLSFKFLRQLALGLSTSVLLLKMNCQALPTSR